ncbi:MAG TPA: bifunctional phosphopantothenoylcysteine decarboxylase/phosphopantothenate--cysteine ligase CoaBC [Vicinamibacterales bacterium]|nr:bifunctional phosphopantothenoylcysteine decarboxylase/phosphopantothenate--cysteine ligase CoaBC [Vicinamibacterales bacterium]
MALIALGVTGGIGAYKAVEIARGLQKNGHEVVAIMTRSAEQFVGPLTFEAITRRPVITDQYKAGANADIEHIAIASNIDLLLVAPATANTIGKFANGLADDFLSSLYTATKAPVMIAPAMNTNMFEHPAVAKNLETLIARGIHVVEPGSGYLACGWIGKGRLAEPEDVVAAAEQLLTSRRPASLAGRNILVTAGPTFEDIDPVRFVGNRSSGRMGYALAAEASRRGASVTLVSGPTHLSPPAGATLVKVRSAADMHAAVMERVAGQDAVIMSAAVADYTPAEPGQHKMKKGDGPMTITLNRTKDILGDVGKLPTRTHGVPVLVGFAAETHDVVAYATAKLRQKGADFIVANDVSRSDAGFDVDTNAVTLVSASGNEEIPLQSKDAIAARILDRLEQVLSAAPAKNAAVKA